MQNEENNFPDEQQAYDRQTYEQQDVNSFDSQSQAQESQSTPYISKPDNQQAYEQFQSMSDDPQAKEQPRVYAGFFPRFAAYIIDSIIVNFGILILKAPLAIATLFTEKNFLSKDLIFQYSISDIFFYILGVLYFIIMTYSMGATLGKKLFHIQVVSCDADRKPGLWEIIYRETVGRFLSGLILCIGYIIVAVHQEKRGLHDLLADTCVIYNHTIEKKVGTPIQVKERKYKYYDRKYAENA